MTKDIKKENYYILDILKFFFCLCVIGLHSELLIELNPNFYYFFEKGILRLAVPFFMVTSGFLLAKNYSKEESIEVFIKYSKRLLKLLIFFELIGMAMNFCTQLIIEKNGLFQIIKGFIKSAIFYPFNALWYIQAVIVGMWISYPFVKKKKTKIGLLFGFLLYIFALLCNSYYFIADGSEIIKNYMNICISARNGLFVGFFFVLLGFELHKLSDRGMDKRILYFSLIVIYFIYLIEIIFIRGKISLDDKSLFISSPLISSILLLIATTYKTNSTKTIILRNLSTGMYLLHRPVLSTLLFVLSSIINIEIRGSLLFLTVTALSMLICLVSYKFDLKLSKFLK